VKIELVTLLGSKLSVEGYEVILPTAYGEISIFPGHEPLVTLLAPGSMAVRMQPNDPDEALEYYATTGGIVEAGGNLVRVLADEAESGDEIAEDEARAAYERAVKMRAEARDHIELEKAKELIDRHAVRLKVADLHRRRRRMRLN
jgi:F-type H+-transporting ATPase subunit epsilon